MQERGIEAKAIKFAQSNGWLVRKLKWSGRRGAPDRLFIKSGVVIFGEFKQPKKDATVQQGREHKRLRDHGAYVVTIHTLELAHEIFR